MKAIGYDYVWTTNGRIYVRKDSGSPSIKIIKNKDLNELKLVMGNDTYADFTFAFCTVKYSNSMLIPVTN